jgi:hypothetical protein
VSIVLAQAALETALNGLSPAIDTQWENTAYTPTVNIPYQQVDFIYADTLNPEMGAGYEQRGVMFIRLRYPEGVGASVAKTRAELIKTTFKRGNTYSNGGLIVRISNTCTIKGGVNIDGRYLVPVEVPLYFQVNL